jgi:hypothetical protein
VIRIRTYIKKQTAAPKQVGTVTAPLVNAVATAPSIAIVVTVTVAEDVTAAVEPCSAFLGCREKIFFQRKRIIVHNEAVFLRKRDIFK